MPELQEVFRMATQKVDQDDGALERQVTKQRKAARNRQVGAFATVAVFIAIAVGRLRAHARRHGWGAGGLALDPARDRWDGDGIDGRRRHGQDHARSRRASPSAGTFYAVSPDHKTIAFNACCAQVGPIMAANVDGTQVHALTPTDWDGYAAQWSPDGSQIVYQQRQAATLLLGDLFVQDVRTGQRTRVTNFDQTQRLDWWFTFPSFSADGRSILFQLPSGNGARTTWDLWSVPVGGGQQTLVRRNAAWGGYSPDGKRARVPRAGGPERLHGRSALGRARRRRQGSSPGSFRGSLLAEVVSGRDPDLLLGPRLDLRTERRDRCHDPGRRGRQRGVVRRPHADRREPHELIIGRHLQARGA